MKRCKQKTDRNKLHFFVFIQTAIRIRKQRSVNLFEAGLAIVKIKEKRKGIAILKNEKLKEQAETEGAIACQTFQGKRRG